MSLPAWCMRPAVHEGQHHPAQDKQQVQPGPPRQVSVLVRLQQAGKGQDDFTTCFGFLLSLRRPSFLFGLGGDKAAGSIIYRVRSCRALDQSRVACMAGR